MYIKIIGSVIILVCTTLIGVDMAGVKKETTERYKKIGEYFALVQERLKCGSSCIADVLTDCSEHFDGIIYSSTVCPTAKNIVLFNKHYAVPYGSVQDYII